MIVYKVIYTVTESFVQRNEENVKAFLADFRALDTNSFQYNVYQGKDKKTFVHFSHFRDADIQNTVLNVPSFVSFQEQRDASGLEQEPSIEEVFPLGSSKEVLPLEVSV